MDSHPSVSATNESEARRIPEPVAVIGIGCRFPGGAASPNSYWRLLRDGVDAISETPPERWNLQRFYYPGATRPGKTQSRWGGYVDGIDRFDPQLFGISPKEASCMDPQQRMLLEVAWRAFEDAGQPIGSVAGRPVSVFVGISSIDYAVAGLSHQDHGVIGPYSNTGGSHSIAANRISYCFDLRGPSVAIDTACSSSLVALHLACESLQRGESEMALCGGANALLLPDFYVAFSQLGVLSPDGRCKTFDARANGYVRSEGAGMVLLKPLRDAIRDHDPIYSVIRATVANQDGHTPGLTVPSRQAQESLVRAACEKAGIDPADVQYVEAHGTGTPVGDPIEASALGTVLCADRDADDPCLVGSVKTNIGHLEAGAGIASLIKVSLALHHDEIPAHLHLQTTNPDIDLDALRIRIPTKTQAWPRADGPRRAGINGFGYGGANAHVLVEQAPEEAPMPVGHGANGDQTHTIRSAALVLPISARSESALAERAQQMAEWLNAESNSLTMEKIAASAAYRRDHFEYRGAVVGESIDEWASGLRAVKPAAPRPATRGGNREHVASTHDSKDGVLFVCCGQGTQWWAMGRGLYQSNEVYRQTIDRCDREFAKHADWSLNEELQRDESESRMHETSIAQPALFALQVGLAKCWEQVGVRPGAIIGHSVGEISASYLCGALSFEDACLVAIHRGRTMDLASSRGAMIAAGLSAEEARLRIEAEGIDVSVAAINSPSSVTISGDAELVEMLARSLEQDGVFCKRLVVQYAFHSQQMDPVRDELLKSLAALQPRASKIDFISTVTGESISGEEIDAVYWWNNVRQSVQFADAVMAASNKGFATAIELGPHPILSYAINECCHEVGNSIQVVPSLRRDEPDERRFAESIATAYNVGVQIDWRGLYDYPRHFTRLPEYPFQRQKLWAESHESRHGRLAASHPLLGESTDHSTQIWHSRLDLNLQTSIRDHRVRGNCVLPAAAMIETAMAAARAIHETESVALGRIQFLRPCPLTNESPLHLETSYDADRGQLRLLTREGNDSAWNELATAEILREVEPQTRLAKSLGEIRSRCKTEFEGSRFYDFCKLVGLEYGDAFRGLERGWRCDGEALAKVRLNEAQQQSSGDWFGFEDGIHPALLDSCFHTMIAADANYDHTIDGLYLPREIERIEFMRPARGVLLVHARIIEKTHRRMVADVDILDGDGQPCILIRGFVSHRAGKGVGEESFDDLLYCYRWTPSEVEDDGIVSVQETSSRAWCVLADQSQWSEALIDGLRERGDRAIRIEHGGGFNRISNDRFVLNPEQIDDFDALLRELSGELGDAEIHFVYLWGLDVPGPDALDACQLRQSAILTTLAPLHLVQSWQQRFESRPARLTVVTSGAQSLDEGTEAVSVAQTPLIGMSRVIVSEFGAFRTKLVDLPSVVLTQENQNGEKPTDALLDSLIRELTLEADPEDELMYRGGQRYAHRFVPQFEQPLPPDVCTTTASRLDTGGVAGVDELCYRSMSRARLGPAQVEIEVAAAGLNFSDVMKVLGLYPGIEGEDQVNLGAECSGRITRIGSEVTQWKVGDDVIAVARGCFATHAVSDAALVARKPPNLSFEEAATIPIAFLTAAYALEDCARIRDGESILIHAASGGVGLAAIQLAKRAGVTVYATAGSEKKREYVRQQGAALVMDSRSLRFADQVMAATDGRGVDAILNSLPGEAIPRGLATLKVGGRFLEIGKRDLYDDRSLGMYPLRNNLAFFAIDLDQLLKTHTELIGTKLRELVEQLALGNLKPLPVDCWEADETDAAFRFMQQAQHIGKVVVRYSKPPQTVFVGQHAPVQFHSDGTYWIVGGLGGFGLQVARWLGERGAGTLVLSGRRGVVEGEALEQIEALKSAGVSVHVIPADVTDPKAVNEVLQKIDADLPPLRGVIHAAMVLEDSLLANLDRATLQRVLYPKVLGGWNLHQATLGRELDHFILFSSLSSVFGHAGQASYSAANALLDGLAHYRRAQGLPACVINWGHLGEVGYLAEREELSERLRRQGVLSFSVDEAMQCLDHALGSELVQLSVLKMDWSVWRGLGTTGDVSPRFAHLIRRGGSGDGHSVTAEEIRRASSDRRREIVGEILKSKVESLLGLGEDQVVARRSLLELGLDSLMAVELRNWIESQIKITLPISELMRDASIEDITEAICEIVAEETAELTQTIVDDSETESRIDSTGAKELLDSLPDLPQDQVADILARLLREQESTSDDPV